jgi:protein-tyrosine-phosphatase
MIPAVNQKRLIVYCDEGVGRSQVGRVMLKDRLPDMSILAAGLGNPKSGRITMHPSVIKLVNERYGIDVSKEKITLLKPEMVTNDTIAIGLTNTPPPDFLKKKALDIFLAPVDDPAGDIDSILDFTATRIYYVAWLTALILTRSPEVIGIRRDEHNFVQPRYLSSFEPPNIEEEYSWREFGYELFLNSRRK